MRIIVCYQMNRIVVMRRTHLLVLLILFFCFHSHADEIQEMWRESSKATQDSILPRLDAYISSHPKDIRGLMLKGMVFSNTGKAEEAIQVFTEVADKHPELPEAFNNLAVLYANQGKTDQARFVLLNLIQTHPFFVTAYENLGDIYSKLSNESLKVSASNAINYAKSAIDAYSKAIYLDKNNLGANKKLQTMNDQLSRLEKSQPIPSNGSFESNNKSNIPNNLQSAKGPDKLQTLSVQAVSNRSFATLNDASSESNEIEAMLRNWAKAWSNQDVGTYLAFYSETFKTPNGESRGLWQKIRTDRITHPKTLKVEIMNPKIEINADTAVVTFTQSYQSDDNPIVMDKKNLVLRKTDNSWRIEQEKTM